MPFIIRESCTCPYDSKLEQRDHANRVLRSGPIRCRSGPAHPRFSRDSTRNRAAMVRENLYRARRYSKTTDVPGCADRRDPGHVHGGIEPLYDTEIGMVLPCDY